MVIVLRTSVGFAEGLDYSPDASAAIDALVRGDFGSFATNPGQMGDSRSTCARRSSGPSSTRA